jgi:hypothetical protein
VKTNGAVLTLEPLKHKYQLDGAPLMGVGEVLKKLGFYDFRFVSKDDLEYKRQVGAAVHKAVELYDIGRLNNASLDPIVVPYLEAWKIFRADTKCEVLYSELPVYSKVHRFAGTLDKIIRWDGAIVLPDIKATAGVAKVIALQTGAYALAARESHGIKVQKRCAIQLKPEKSGKPYQVVWFDKKADESVFLSCLHIAGYMNLTSIQGSLENEYFNNGIGNTDHDERDENSSD